MPDSTVAYVFPGQGSQYRGIGRDLYTRFESVKSVFEEASDILGYDIAKISFDGPDEQINLTRYTQPILLTHQIACFRIYRELAPNPFPIHVTGGHSLGEYSALVASNALSFGAALSLVATRGQLMGEYGEGEMSALPLALEDAKIWADTFYCAIAGINLEAQTVVGGAAADLDALEKAFAEQNPRKRTVRLKTEGAFHTYYMIGAARRFRSALDTVVISEPETRVLSNYTARYHEADPDKIKANLFFQLFHPVNWMGCMRHALDAGVDTFIEFGGGIGTGETPAEKRPNLESIIKKACRGREVRYFPAINVETIETAAAASS